MGVSKNRGTPKWMVYNGKPYQNGWFGDTPIFGNTHILFFCGGRDSWFWDDDDDISSNNYEASDMNFGNSAQLQVAFSTSNYKNLLKQFEAWCSGKQQMFGWYPTTGKAPTDTTQMWKSEKGNTMDTMDPAVSEDTGWLIHHSSILVQVLSKMFTLSPPNLQPANHPAPPCSLILPWSPVCFWLPWVFTVNFPFPFGFPTVPSEELIKEGVELSSLPSWVCQVGTWPLTSGEVDSS